MTTKDTLHINGVLLEEAAVYASRKGVDLSSVVENFLSKWVSDNSVWDKIDNFPVSDEVRSLTRHAGSFTHNLDPEEERDGYFSEKYGL